MDKPHRFGNFYVSDPESVIGINTRDPDLNAWVSARLACAAPDLLAACKFARSAWRAPAGPEWERNLAFAARDHLDAAIAKAEGSPCQS